MIHIVVTYNQAIQIRLDRVRKTISNVSSIQQQAGIHCTMILKLVNEFSVVANGLDEGRDGECTDVSLLDLPVYQQRWKDYLDAPAFEFVDEIIIVGS